MSAHESFCLYPYTRDKRDLRPATCPACTGIWNAAHRGRERACWGTGRGTAANGIVNLIWLAVLLGAVTWAIVANV